MFGYDHNWAGPASLRYPSGRLVSYGCDAGGRVRQAGSYSTSIQYAAHGAVRQIALGNGRYEETCFNPRLQAVGIRVGQAAGAGTCADPGTDLLNLAFGYGAGASNNGNLTSQTIKADGKTFSQSYGYDPFNRVSSAQEGANWSRAFRYDVWGNMWVESGTGVPIDPFTPRNSGWYNAKNQLANAGLNTGYDPAGNQERIGGYTNTFDGENRLKTSTLNSVTATYYYDGEGRRVKKERPAGTTVYVYDAAGQLAAEYGVVEAGEVCKTCYLSGDHLGSTRLMTDQTGGMKSLHDFLPFGEEVPAGTGGRSATYYPAGALAINDGTTQKFTGKERDTETGLDYFGARYFSGAQGRFTSPDPLLASAKLEDPQTWNRYVYARNNPLRYTDPLGLYPSPAYNCDDQGTPCLNDEQRRVLQSTTITKNGQELSGEALWNAWGEAQQNAYVNLTDHLASVKLDDGTTALSQVSSLIGGAGETGMGADRDRIFANIGGSVLGALKGSSDFTAVSAGLHPGFNADSFKDTGVMLGNIQFSFGAGGTRVDIDHDIGNIAARDPFKRIVGALVHAEEVVQNSVFKTKTNQDVIRKLLINNPNVQTITPSPDPKFNRR